MRTTTITVTGKTDEDVQMGIEEALRRFSSGNTSGMDRNSEGSFYFKTTGEEEVEEDEEIHLLDEWSEDQ